MDATYTSDGANGKVCAVALDRDQTLLRFDPVALAVISQDMAALLPDLPHHSTRQCRRLGQESWLRTREEKSQF